MLKYICPIGLIVLNIGAAICSVISKDYKTAVYWVAAAVLNAVVAF